MAFTYEQLGQKVKAQYPQYKDMSDEELGKLVASKYPQYQQQIKEETSVLGSIISKAKDYAASIGKGFVEGKEEAAAAQQELQQQVKTGQKSFLHALPETVLTSASQVLLPAARAVEAATTPAILGTTKAFQTISEKAVEPALQSLIGKANVKDIQQKAGVAISKLEPLAQKAKHEYESLSPTTKSTLGNVGRFIEAISVLPTGVIAGATGIKAGVQAGKKVKAAAEAFDVKRAKLVEAAATKRAAQEAKTAAISKVTKATQTGLPKPVVSLVNRANPAEKKSMLKMLNIHEQAQKTALPSKRAIEVAGEDITKRSVFLNQQRKQAGAALKREIDKMPSEPVDITAQYTELTNDLTDKKVAVRSDGTLDFRNSSITDSADKSLLQELYNDLRPNKEGNVIRTPSRIYTLRQKYFNKLDLGKRNQTFTDLADTIASRTRDDLSNPLQKLSSRYKTLSKQYAENTSYLSDLAKLLNYKGSLDDLGAQALRAGEVSQRILGNAAARPQSLLQRLHELTKKQGFKSTESIEKKIKFADILEAVAGSTQTRGVGRQVGRGIAEEVAETAVDVATGGIKGVVAKFIKEALKKSPEDQLRALRQLLIQ